MKIKIGKIMSGETIVGRISETEDKLENCLILQAMSEPGGKGVRIGITPFWAPFSEEKADININKLLCKPIDASGQLVEQYTQITSGIHVATSNDLKNISQHSINNEFKR